MDKNVNMELETRFVYWSPRRDYQFLTKDQSKNVYDDLYAVAECEKATTVSDIMKLNEWVPCDNMTVKVGDIVRDEDLNILKVITLERI